MTDPARTLPPIVDPDAAQRARDALRAARREEALLAEHRARAVELTAYAATEAARALGDTPAARDVIHAALRPDSTDTTPAPTNEAPA